MGDAPKKIHVTTKAYLSGWTAGGVLRAGDVQYGGPSKLKTTAQVAWRREWWGQDNPELNRVCEAACGALEQHIPGLMRRVKAGWPVSRSDRSLLAQLAGLHVLRTPAYLAWFSEQRMSNAPVYRERFTTEEGFQRFVEMLQSSEHRSQELLSQGNKLATLIGAMHWNLLEFDEPLLITSDQPVVVVPLLQVGERQPITAFPPGGNLMDIVEIRFPLSPHLALIATWQDDVDQHVTGGTWHQALNLNTAVAATTDRHWFRTPERVPALPSFVLTDEQVDVGPIGQELIPGYGSASVPTSRRRREVHDALEELIESENDSTIMLLTVEPKAA